MGGKLVGISDNYRSAFGDISYLVNGGRIISRRINTRLSGLVKETSSDTSPTSGNNKHDELAASSHLISQYVKIYFKA